MSDDRGQLRPESAVRFERLLPGPVERVWEFLTRGEQVAHWFGGGGTEYVIEPRPGGRVSLADGHIRGVVTQWRPPRLLAYTWNVFMPGEEESRYPESYVMFELRPEGESVLLVLTHRPISDEFSLQTMMGWHTLLEQLGQLLHGETLAPREVVMERNRVLYGVKEIKR